MSEPVRMTAEELVKNFGCTRRLATRIGALLAKRTGVSALVLEEAAARPELRDLLLESSLLGTPDLSAELTRLAALPPYAAVARSLPLTVKTVGEWQVIIAEEETLAEDGFASVAEPAPSFSPERAAQTAASAQSSLSSPASSAQPLFAPQAHSSSAEALPAVRPESANGPGGLLPAVGGGSLAEAFSEQEVARLRVEIFAGSDSVRKVSALRQFAFTGVAPAEKARVFRQALADEDKPLRQAAVAGLRQFGADAGWVECLLLFADGVELPVALGRLKELAARKKAGQSGEVEAGLLLMAGCLRDRTSAPELAEAALNGLSCLVPQLPAGFAAWDDLAGLLQERLLAGQLNLLAGCRAVFAALEPVSGGAVSRRLLKEAGETSSTEYKALLLDLLAGMPLAEEAREELLPLAVQTLCVLPLEHASARFLRKILTDRADAGLRLLAEAILRCDVAHQRSFLRFADNALHSFPVAEETRNALAQSCLSLLRSAPLQLRTDLIETHVLIRDDISPEVRKQTALLLLSSVRDYAQWPLCDYLENSLVCLGRPAVEPLLTGLREQRNTPAGAILARALGRIGMALPVADEAVADDILRELSRLTFSDNRIMDALHLSMGMLAARAGVSEAVNALVMRTLLGRLTGTPADAALIRALGYCAAGNLAPDSELPAIVALCLRHLETEQAAPTLEVQTRGGEEVITFGNEVGIYADLIPAGLTALEQILLGRRIPAPVRDDLLTRLAGLWENSGSLHVQWGLANVTLLTEILGRVGESEHVTDRQRVMLAATLRKRGGSLPVLQALAKIAAVPSRLPQMDKLAAALLLKALERLGQPESGAEDQEAYLRLLLKVFSRGRFELSKGSPERLYERVAQAAAECVRQGVTGAAEAARTLQQSPLMTPAAREILDSCLERLPALSVTEASGSVG